MRMSRMNRIRFDRFMDVLVFCLLVSWSTSFAKPGGEKTQISVDRFEQWTSIGVSPKDGNMGSRGSGRSTLLFAGWYSVISEESDTRTAFVFVDELTMMDSTEEVFTRSFAGLGFLLAEVDGKWQVLRRWDDQRTNLSNEAFLRVVSDSSVLGSVENSKWMGSLRSVVRSLDTRKKGTADDAFANWFFTRESIHPLSEVDAEVWVRGRDRFQDSVHTDFVVDLRVSRFRDEGNGLDGSNLTVRLEMNDSYGRVLSMPSVWKISARGIYELDGNLLIGTLRDTLVVWEDWVERPEFFSEFGFSGPEEVEGK